YLCKVRSLTSKSIIFSNENNRIYYFAFTELGTKQVCHFFKEKSNYELPYNKLTIVKLPWLNFVPINNNYDVIDLCGFISFFDVIKAFLLSIASFVSFFKPSCIKWILHLYTAPSWFLVALAMNNVKGSFASSEHYDRWAVLTDILCRMKRKQYILIQHGSLMGLKTKNFESFNLPYKLRAVSEIAVFNEVEFYLFSDYILSKIKNDGLIIHYFQQPFFVSSIEKKELSVLIVGHSLCEREQLKIGELLATLSDEIVVYYKEHPKARASEKVKMASWNFITDDNYFPDVDLVISYPSTLALQYQDLNKIVLLHELDNINQDEINEIIKTVIKSRSIHGK
ncbi:hypothetical protein AIY08_11190, partial [Salmonella enterica]|nr:hypothetical protein [Salmonella enterica]EEO4298446.1 hypothetical protein [Salmonella enterica subsp. houtenae serovar 48:g,z51:-]